MSKTLHIPLFFIFLTLLFATTCSFALNIDTEPPGGEQNQDVTQLWKLPEGAKKRLGRGGIYAITFSADGKYFAVGGTAGIWLYDAQTYEPLDLFNDGHPRSVVGLVFSPTDEKLLASAGEADDVIHLWDVETGRILRTLVGHSDIKSDTYWAPSLNRECTSISSGIEHARNPTFSPDGQILANGNSNATVDLWEVSTGKRLRTITTGHPTGWVPLIKFTSDGQALISRSGDSRGELRFWDVSTGKLLHTKDADENKVFSKVFSPDRRFFATSSRFSVKVWDAETGEFLRTLSHTYKIGGGLPIVLIDIGSYAFSANGQILATAALHGGRIDFWDVETGTLLHTIYGHTTMFNVASVAFSPDGRTLASNNAVFINLWDAETGELLHTLSGHFSNFIGVAFSPDGHTLASASSTLRLWDARTGTHLETLSHQVGAPPYSTSFLAYSPDGQRVASLNGNKGLDLWDVRTGTLLQTFQGVIRSSNTRSTVSCVAFSPDGRILAAGDMASTIGLWDMQTGRLLRRLHGENKAIKDDQVTYVDLGPIPWPMRHPTAMWGAVQSVAFSPNRRILASGGDDSADYTLHLWDVSTGKHLRAFTETKEIRFVTFSPDGQTLLTTGTVFDKTIDFWDIATGELLHTLNEHKGGVGSLAFSPDGQTLASASRDGTVLLWDYPLLQTLPPPSYLPEDVNTDGRVDIQDLEYVSRRVGDTCGGKYDVNGDTVIDVRDLVLIAAAMKQ